MRIVVCAIISFIGSFSTCAISAERLNIIMFERDPWLMVIGSDSPIFVKYSSGLTIFQKKHGSEKAEYFSVNLNNNETTALLAKMASLNKLEKHYSLSNYSDQPTVELHYFNEEYVKQTGALIKRTIYGRLSAESKDREKAPPEFTEIYEYLTNYTHKKALPWSPAYLEVMVWPYEYAPDESINWPSNWPDTKSESTIQRGESFSIFLPYSEKEKFIKFIQTRKEKGAVLINGRKWAVSTRIPFPHEIAHNKALQPTQ